jgi:hypothetical protein
MEMRLDAVTDFLNDQPWFQQLKQKWEELDPQSRTYLQIAGFVTTVVILLFAVFSTVWSVHKLKVDSSEKSDLLNMLQNANEELRRLHDNAPDASASDNGKWDIYFGTVASNAGLDRSSLNISAEKPGNSSDISKEALYDIGMKKITVRQAIKFAFGLESGSRPVKVRNLIIDTHADPEGYIDATLAVSGFSVILDKDKK